ncbi:UNVERIFIED_CONTAM: hypothetical protein FKN15_042311 [Acipenser sinensis]
MGQSQTIPLQPPDEKLDVVFEVFSQAVLHASQKLKQYLGFVDPQHSLRVSTCTLNAVFLIHFITFCKEKGVDGSTIHPCHDQTAGDADGGQLDLDAHLLKQDLGVPDRGAVGPDQRDVQSDRNGRGPLPEEAGTVHIGPGLEQELFRQAV